MDDMTIKNRITDAMREPPIPESLMERTVELARAVGAGREAEKKLARTNEALPREEKEQLVAQALIGRLMRNGLPPEGVSAEKLTEELRSREGFREAMEKPTNVLRSELKNGKLILGLAAKERARTEKEPAEKILAEVQKNTPHKEAPVKKTPERKGPVL